MDESGSDSDSDNELKAENLELKSRIYKLEQAAIRREKEL